MEEWKKSRSKHDRNIRTFLKAKYSFDAISSDAEMALFIAECTSEFLRENAKQTCGVGHVVPEEWKKSDTFRVTDMAFQVARFSDKHITNVTSKYTANATSKRIVSDYLASEISMPLPGQDKADFLERIYRSKEGNPVSGTTILEKAAIAREDFYKPQDQSTLMEEWKEDNITCCQNIKTFLKAKYSFDNNSAEASVATSVAEYMSMALKDKARQTHGANSVPNGWEKSDTFRVADTAFQVAKFSRKHVSKASTYVMREYLASQIGIPLPGQQERDFAKEVYKSNEGGLISGAVILEQALIARRNFYQQPKGGGRGL